MNDLIEAFTIFKKYGEDKFPTTCDHDILMVYLDAISEETDVSEEDRKRLDELGFFWSEEYNCFASFTFGSC